MKKSIIYFLYIAFSSGCISFHSMDIAKKEQNLSPFARSNSIGLSIETSIMLKDKNVNLALDAEDVETVKEISKNCSDRSYFQQTTWTKEKPPEEKIESLVLACHFYTALKEKAKLNLILLPGSQKSENDRNLRLSIEVNPHQSTMRNIWAFASMLTVGIIPYWGDIDYHLKVQFEKGDLQLGGRTTSIGQILLLVASPFFDGPSESLKKLSDEMASQIVSQLSL